jgi:two-component system, cell cycle sensor histidine kinase and response regulator CckA
MIRPKILDLNKEAMNIEKMLQRVIGEQIELDIIPAIGLWPVEVDATQFEQVIINLAVNARDAMPDGGKLTIETTNVVLDEAYVAAHLETQPGDHVLLTVSDTGCGISKTVQAHIFEPFFTTKEVNEGTGLGLSTVFGIIKQNRGNIWVYSEEGVGTTFKIYLPRAATSAFSIPPTPVGVLPRGVETILLVEDEALVRDLASRVLHEQGYTVLVANNGWEALRLAREHIGVIHLLLTDVVMPGIGGKALADQLMAVFPNLKVLFTSGYTNNSVVTQGMLLPGIKFLEKPFSSVSLTHKVREVLDGRTP